MLPSVNTLHTCIPVLETEGGPSLAGKYSSQTSPFSTASNSQLCFQYLCGLNSFKFPCGNPNPQSGNAEAGAFEGIHEGRALICWDWCPARAGAAWGFALSAGREDPVRRTQLMGGHRPGGPGGPNRPARALGLQPSELREILSIV